MSGGLRGDSYTFSRLKNVGSIFQTRCRGIIVYNFIFFFFLGGGGARPPVALLTPMVVRRACPKLNSEMASRSELIVTRSSAVTPILSAHVDRSINAAESVASFAEKRAESETNFERPCTTR